MSARAHSLGQATKATPLLALGGPVPIRTAGVPWRRRGGRSPCPVPPPRTRHGLAWRPPCVRTSTGTRGQAFACLGTVDRCRRLESMPPTHHGRAAASTAWARTGLAQAAPSALPSVRASVPTPKEGPLPAQTPDRATVAREHRRAHAATSRPRHGEPAQHSQHTHTRTHALESTPDQEEAARDPGDADTWAQTVSRGKEKKKRRRRAEFGPEGPRGAEARGEIRPEDALPFFLFSCCTALTRGSHRSD